MTASRFLHEGRAYALLAAAGLRVPRHGFLESGALPFAPGEPIVLKGIADELWHKSDKGAVAFAPFETEALRARAAEMRAALGPEHPWIGGLVCEKVAFQRLAGLPTEALVSLKRDPDAGWMVVCGIGGLQADAWAALAPPLLWPVALATPEQALTELKAHWLGRTWLGLQRGTSALTDEAKLRTFLQGLWRAVDGLAREGVTLLELNPVVLDAEGLPTALDGVGTLAPEGDGAPAAPDPAWYRALVAPRDLVIAGVSSREGTVGRIILENVQRSSLKGALRLIKPGAQAFLGLPCLASVADLATAPTDQLIVSLPAAQTLELVEQLCHQGGGATVVYIVAGGLGDGADTEGLGKRLVACLETHRRAGKWTPALLGPNGLGLYSPDLDLNTLFIPDEKLPLRPQPGHAALVSQSGAFLITRLSRRPELGLRAAIAIGNQMDLRCSDFLRGFGEDPAVKVVGAYLEGFAPGDLQATAEAAAQLRASGRRVLLYKGGRSQEGMAAASSHTGALAGDAALQASVLRRSGAMLAERIEAFDAALSWLGAYAEGTPRRVAIVTNAGFESVASADLLTGPFRGAKLTEAETPRLAALIEAHGLAGLVSPRLPLDLTPMADEAAYLASTQFLLETEADAVVVGLVPLTRRLATADPAAFGPFARALKELATASGKWVGVAVEGGAIYDAYRQGLREAGLPVFLTMEEALEGLRVIASEA